MHLKLHTRFASCPDCRAWIRNPDPSDCGGLDALLAVWVSCVTQTVSSASLNLQRGGGLL